MKTIVYLICALLFSTSCENYSDEVEKALVLAGGNRDELEHVLEYCKNRGKIAYKSACFLIENMQYHESKNIENITIDSYREYFIQTDSIYSLIFKNMSLDSIKRYKNKDYDSLRLALTDIFNSIVPLKGSHQKGISDLQTINADFLIDNIESALRIWENNGYSYKKDFDFFKEFILPYRTTDESLFFNRSSIRAMFNKRISDSIDSSIYNKLERYKVYVDKCRWINKHIKVKEHLGIYDLLVPKFKMDCHNMTNWSSNIFRACGVPTVYEFTPKWKDRDSRHFWCVSLDSIGILQPYTAPDNNLREDWDSDIKYASKVYRRTFGAQKETPYYLAGENEYIPSTFQSPLLSDQTFRYHQTVTLRIPMRKHSKNKLAYLCMLANHDHLIPVGWGRIDSFKQEIIFEQVPLNTLFFPVCYDNDAMLSVADPFILHSTTTIKDIPLPLTSNKQSINVIDLSVVNKELLQTDNKEEKRIDIKYKTLSCNINKKIQMHLLRKYPEKRRMKNFREKLKGACLLGGCTEKGEYDTLLVLDHIPFPYLQELSVNNTKKYRYYRFCTYNGEPVNIAHIEFLGHYSSEHPCSSPTLLPIFSEEELNKKESSPLFRINGIPLKTGSKPEHAFDNDFSTYVGSSGIGMDFSVPVQINSIRFVPRNANNMIVPGDSYLLLYYDNGWKEHKTLYAKYNYLDFQDVPSASLYLLRNLTEGKEELPFMYINKKQYFLHSDKLPL